MRSLLAVVGIAALAYLSYLAAEHHIMDMLERAYLEGFENGKALERRVRP
jgi:hypothetical protein